jgi:hypothetical protein
MRRAIILTLGLLLRTAMGQGLDLDTYGSYLYNTTANWRSADTRGTVVAWLKYTPTSGAGSVFRFLSTADQAVAGTHVYFDVFNNGNGNVYAIVRSNSTYLTYINTTNALVTTGAVHQVVVQSTGSNYLIYVDGASVSFALTLGNNTGRWLSNVLNRDNVHSGAMRTTSLIISNDGILYALRYYSRALTAAEIKTDWITRGANYPRDSALCLDYASPGGYATSDRLALSAQTVDRSGAGLRFSETNRPVVVASPLRKRQKRSM